ncbi:MAG: MarR family transcriptional regulator [Actinomycetota bacterium]|nr:MarR family transcriptional regulator [Actinomycetota bacterium]
MTTESVTAPGAPVRDRTDLLVERWHAQNESVDVDTKSLAIRLRRANQHVGRALREDLARLEMETWEAEVLLAVRRHGGRSVHAGELVRDSQVTSGAITNRIARLERRGWARRDVDPEDRRQVLVSLTDEGRRAADRVIASRAGAEERLFAVLDRSTRARMAADLRALLVGIEGPADEEEDLP